ncbi:hypothetical protein SAMN05421805_10648 [Saccharopolyspora antimicrobica]|uniref:Uncharacterized protein n=1 Tax=Saccharopolyspora antimicrobica TaxID=455193 RepID=A0A1I5AYC3_9PSEU|nr:hypothetical protein [Saccharopolyspora antimicrobica]RKT86407.1 hypothetical protein ATL45_4774 [Saccharopolyspora antimicrobica]SFN67455.1 hypothetical protein SAMN05421805_10648 [Saccharopolyspora antimicrobica]
MSVVRLVSRQLITTLLVFSAWLTVLGVGVQQRWEQARFDDTGSESTEKAVIAAMSLAAALGLGGAITALVLKYQAQLH